MPKKTKFHPNERVDIPDITRITEFASESVGFEFQKVITGDRGYILNGFRVRIINDSGNPARVIVYNGNALDVAGQHLNNEADPAYAQEISLTGNNTTFYLEIERVESDTDDDSRAFWDPSVANTSPIPNGEEFQATVPTRITPTWRIVRPVSTVGFTWSLTNPTTTRLPLVRLRTDGTNQILDLSAENPGLQTVFPATTLVSKGSIGDSQLQVADARLFTSAIGSNSITVDPDGLSGGTAIATVSSVDTTHNIITLTAPLAADYVAGTALRATGLTSEYVQERPAANYAVVAASVHPDNSARLFQGNEDRGAGFITDKDDASVRSDMSVADLKAYIDVLASQLQELKWGAMRVGETGTEVWRAPPTAFDLVNTPPRYFDKSRSVQGAGTVSVSVGDGVTSFGDFNGNTEAAVQAAVDAAPSGTAVFIKQGSYTFSNTVTLSGTIDIIGERDSVINTGVDPFPLFTIADESLATARFRGLSLRAETVGASIVYLSDNAATVEFCDCELLAYQSVVETAGKDCARVSIDRCSTAFATGPCIGNTSNTPDISFLRITDTVISSISSGDVLYVGDVGQLEMHNVSIVSTDSSVGTNTGALVKFQNFSQAHFSNIQIQCNGSKGVRFFSALGATTSIGSTRIDGVTFSGSLLYAEADSAFYCRDFDSLSIKNVFVEDEVGLILGASISHAFMDLGASAASSASGHDTTFPAISLENVEVRLDGQTGIGVRIGYLSTGNLQVTLRDVRTRNCYTGVYAAFAGKLTVDNCFIAGNGTSSVTGISAGCPSAVDLQDISVLGTSIVEIGHSGGGKQAGIWIYTDPAESDLAMTNLQVHNCFLTGIGGTSTPASEIAGIYVEAGTNYHKCVIKDTVINLVRCAGAGYAFGVALFGTRAGALVGSGASICDNQISRIGANSNFAGGIVAGNGGISGVGELRGIRISGNHIENISSVSPSSLGIGISQVGSGGSLVNCTISENIIEEVGVPSANVGAQIYVGADDGMSGVSIHNNTMNNTNTSNSVSVDHRGGIANNVTVRGNTIIGDGGVYGVVLFGASGASWSHVDVSHNNISMQQTTYTVAFQYQIKVLGDMKNVRVDSNSLAMCAGGFHAPSGCIYLNGETGSGSRRVAVTGNVCTGIAGAYETAPVILNKIHAFTISGNVLDPFDGAAGGSVVADNCLLSITDCEDGVISGNDFVSVDVINLVFFDAACLRILGASNKAGPATLVPVGTNIATEVLFNFGLAAGAIGTLALNLNS
jgi:hypothetical protein